jgi:RNA polymerase-binding transcription factor DksA
MDLAEIQRKLEKRQSLLAGRVTKIEGHLRTPGNRDWTERATESENDEVLEALDTSERQELEDIARALARIENGSYGRCAGCGESIDPGRLEAVPTATKCTGCAA